MRFNFGTSPEGVSAPFSKVADRYQRSSLSMPSSNRPYVDGGCTTEWPLGVEILAFENSSG